MNNIQLIIFAKAPVPGQVKTRLIPVLGAEGAARLAGLMLGHILHQSVTAQTGTVELCVSPDADDQVWQSVNLPEHISITNQGDGDLGTRMQRACERSINNGKSVILLGADCPELDVAYLRKAVTALESHDATLVPATDGGYVLLGLNRFHPLIMEDIPWSTPDVTRITLARFDQLEYSVQLLPALHDIDQPADLAWLPTGYNF